MTKIEPKITEINQKKLVGYCLEMSLVNNMTQALFSGFMPKRKEIKNIISEDIYEIIEYDASNFKKFSPSNLFTKWATLEVSSFETIPEGMKPLTLEKGLYAVFNYKGLAKDFSTLMQYIYGTWIQQSDYILDDRPHFNVLGNKYKNNHPDSEEDVYIPLKKKDHV